jgi:3-vinyl bacteriochlorophyllide hydratase
MNTQFMRREAGGAAFGARCADAPAIFSVRKPYAGLDITSTVFVQKLIDLVAPCPWPASVGSRLNPGGLGRGDAKPSLYSPEERMRRDRSPWTIVQGVLAPVQFVIFAASLMLVTRYLLTGHGYEIATASIVAKTVALYAIMITGSIWEKDIFGKWLFAKAFFWEDVFSMLVLGLQTVYIWALIMNWGSPRQQMMIAIAAYVAYIVNATQFVLKLRAARLEPRALPVGSVGNVGAAL